jgi:raffinose/stachyose/melibiose transport system permease protein
MYTGLYLIIFLANMQRIDVQIIESAQIDGANEGQVLRHIILPSLSGVVVTTAILAISGSLRSFDLIFAMTGGGPARVTQVLSIYMYDNAFRTSPNYPLANAISTVMVVLSFALIGVTRLVEKRFGGKE